MNAPRDPDLIIADWLDDGPLRLPEQTRRAVAVGLRTTSQRRSVIGWPWGLGTSGPAAGPRLFAPLLVGAVVVTVLIGGGVLTSGRPSTDDDASTDTVGFWSSDTSLALTWETSTPMDDPPYLAAVYYDDFTLHGWKVGQPTNVPRAVDDQLLAGTKDAITTDGRKEYVVTVRPTLSRGVIYAPAMPVMMSVEGALLLTRGGYLGQVERPTSNAPYSVTSLVWDDTTDVGATSNKLRVAGQDYPAGMLEEYGSAAVPEGTFTTPEAQALLEEFASSDANPYDLSAAIVQALQDPSRFQYSTDVRGHRCDLSIVDCFATFRDGYCEYYATTMAMILRSLDIPARIVEGFLPGTKVGPGNRWQVLNSDAHAWVQVFFPSYGWIDFDPTGGLRASLAPLPTGAVQGSPGSSP